MDSGIPKLVGAVGRRGRRLLAAARRLGGRTVTVTSTAHVSTGRPERYGKQLATHMSRRHGGGWSPESGSGWMQLGAARADVHAGDGELVLTITCDDPGQVGGLEDAVGRHLAKFGAKDGLVVAWKRSDGTPGTRQPAA